MRDVVEEKDGEFVLPLADFVCDGWDGKGLILKSEDPCEWAGVSADRLDESTARELIGRKARVERATVGRDSTLRVDFAGGVSLLNPASDDYGAWQVAGPGSIFVVAPAGGGEPAIWDSASRSYTLHRGQSAPPEIAEVLQHALDLFGKEKDE